MPLLTTEHFPQEDKVGCLAACSQSILHSLGIRKKQRQLNRLFRLTRFGVPFSRIARLEQFGVQVRIFEFGDDTDLIAAIDQGIAPIVFLRTASLPYWQSDTQHAVVVVGYEASHFYLNDPAFRAAPQRVGVDPFMLAWDKMSYAYALITRHS